MKLSLIRKLLIGVTFISTVTTVSFIVWKVVQKNNLDVEAKSNNKKYKAVSIPKQDLVKVVNYKESTYLFDLPNLEYYLVNKTLNLYPELANKSFTFKVDNQSRPKGVEMSISSEKELNWFYSII